MNQKAMLILGNFVKFGCFTVSGVLLSRHFSKTDLGTYLQGVLLVATVSEIGALGLPKALLFFGGIEKNRKNLIFHVLLMITAAACLFAFCLWLIRDRIGELFSNPALRGVAVLIAANLVFRTINIAFGPVMMILGKVGVMTFVYVLASVANLAAFAAFAYLGSSLKALFLATFLLEALQAGVFLSVFLASKCEGSFHPSARMVRTILAYSSPLVLNVLIILAGRKLDSFLVSGFFRPEEYAVYSRGALELPFSQMILVNIASLLMPVFSRLYHENRPAELSGLLLDEIQKISLLLFPMFFGLLLVHEDLIVFLYSEKYASSAGVFLVYLLLVPIQLYAFDSILQAFNKSKWVNISSLGYALTSLSVGLALIPYLGVLGPAIGMLVGTFVNAVFNIFLINRFLGNPFRAWLPWAKLARALALSAAPLALVWPASRLLPDQAVYRLFLGSAMYYPLAFAVLWKFGALPDDYLKALGRVREKWTAAFSNR